MSSNDVEPIDRLIERFPCFSGLAGEPRDWFRQTASWAQADAKTVLFDIGSTCTAFPLLVDGEIQIVRNTQSGREIELYRVLPGEPCLVSTSCMLGNRIYPAKGIASTPVKLALLNVTRFETLLTEHRPFRNFMFDSFTQRMADLMEKVEQVAFMRLEQRLAQMLASVKSPFHATHQDIATQLGASREVISRQLKTFERSGWIALGRAEISILQPDMLNKLANVTSDDL